MWGGDDDRHSFRSPLEGNFPGVASGDVLTRHGYKGNLYPAASQEIIVRRDRYKLPVFLPEGTLTRREQHIVGALWERASATGNGVTL